MLMPVSSKTLGPAHHHLAGDFCRVSFATAGFVAGSSLFLKLVQLVREESELQGAPVELQKL
jgi:hypothetical protein